MRLATYIFIALSALLFGAMNYVEYTHLQTITRGMKSPDLLPLGYSVTELQNWRQALGPTGAQSYISALPRGFDMFFPIIFGLTIALILFAVLNHFQNFKRLARCTKLLVPIILVLPYIALDYAENEAIVGFLRSTSDDDILASTPGNLTVLKYAFLAMALIILLGFWLAKLQNKRENIR